MKTRYAIALSLVLLVLVSTSLVTPVHAKWDVDVAFWMTTSDGTVYLTTSAAGKMGYFVIFQIDMWYGLPKDRTGFVSFYSGQQIALSLGGYASATVQATAPTGPHVHYFVQVQVYDLFTGTLLGFANYDPRGGTNGGVGF